MHRSLLVLAAIAALAIPSTASADATSDLLSAQGGSSLLQSSTLSSDGMFATSLKAGGFYCPTAGYPYHGAAGSRYTIKTWPFGITLGWIQVEQEYWCWKGLPHLGGTIMGWGQVIGRHYTFPGYCWTDLQLTDQFWGTTWERKAEISGSLGILRSGACVGLRSANARLYYQAGGTANTG